MAAMTRVYRRLTQPLLLLPLLAACSELDINAPLVPGFERDMLLTCVVDTRAVTMSCKAPVVIGPTGIQADRILGGQDTYVKLANTNTSYDGGAQIFQTDVTVQNLIQAAIGTPDGSTVEGVQVFFQGTPIVTAGTGTASVANPDGTGTFTAGGQAYFQYAEILTPYEISAAKTWQFSVEPNTTFTFQVYISTSMVDESVPALDAVWNGSVSTDWFTAANWSNNAVPTATSVVAVPLTAQNPVLTADTEVEYLRVGSGSGLDLGGFTLTVAGNADGTGAISNGSITLSGADVKLNGMVHALRITGSTSLQGSTRATAAVSVTGSLTIKDRALSISIP